MTSCDELLNGALKLIQPEEGDGLRVNVDTVLLAHFTRPKRAEKILEIGCAHGAASLILARRGFCVRGIDIQEHLVELARQNAKLNSLDARFDAADIREYKKIAPAQFYDRIVVNPPYDEPLKSRLSPREAMSASTHGLYCSLEDIMTASRYLLKNKGRLDIILRASRVGELFTLLDKYNTPPKVVKCVHPRPGAKASVVLVEAVRAGRAGVSVEAPLFITDALGNETAELASAYVIEDESRCRL